MTHTHARTLQAQLDAALAAVGAVYALHSNQDGECQTCTGREWPCATVLALFVQPPLTEGSTP